tara:strand:+ start:448 stop:732 length:285 start_codon:yes stop_codon:yes gene_type:complete
MNLIITIILLSLTVGLVVIGLLEGLGFILKQREDKSKEKAEAEQSKQVALDELKQLADKAKVSTLKDMAMDAEILRLTRIVDLAELKKKVEELE